MLRERLSVAIRRRLPGRTPDIDSINLLAQLPTEDVISSGRLITSIRRSLPDQDLAFKAKPAWRALVEAKKAQAREPKYDFSEIIGQAQLQHGYAFTRELEADAKKAKTIQRIKTGLWAVSIVGPVLEGILIMGDELGKVMRENEAMEYDIREAQIQAQIKANNAKSRKYWEEQAKG